MTIKAQITKVNLGHTQINGLLGDDGKVYVAVPQIADHFQFAKDHASREIKSLLGDNFQFIKAITPLNPKAVNILTLDDFQKILMRLVKVERQSASKAKSSPRHLYVISTDDNLYIKIGISNDPPKRLPNIQVGSPSKLSLLFSVALPNARKVEQRLHDKLADFNMNGEWFDAIAWSMVDWSSL